MQIRRIKIAKLSKSKLLQPIFIEDAPVDLASRALPLPIFIQPSAGGDLVWYGWRYLEALSPTDEVNIYFFAKKEHPLSILAAIAHFIRYRRELFPIEIAYIFQYLKENIPSAAQPPKFFAITGQKNFAQWQDSYRRLLQIIPDLQTYLISHKAPLKLWLAWSRWECPAQEQLALLWHRLRPTLSQATLITDLVNDLAASEKISISEILAQVEAQLTSAVSSDQPQNRIDVLIQALRRRRFPNITGYETRLRQLREQLPQHKQIQISWDPNFEIPGVQLTFTLNKTDDLRLLKEFATDHNLTVLREMLALL